MSEIEPVEIPVEEPAVIPPGKPPPPPPDRLPEERPAQAPIPEPPPTQPRRVSVPADPARPGRRVEVEVLKDVMAPIRAGAAIASRGGHDGMDLLYWRR